MTWKTSDLGGHTQHVCSADNGGAVVRVYATFTTWRVWRKSPRELLAVGNGPDLETCKARAQVALGMLKL